MDCASNSINASTSVKLGASESVEFAIKVGVHQESVLSPLLFIIVLEALSKKFRIGLRWELFYADDLALLAESEEELLEMIRQWKDGMEQKGLKVNMGKTKVMNCKVRQGRQRTRANFHVESARKVLEETQYVAQNARRVFTKKCSGIRS